MSRFSSEQECVISRRLWFISSADEPRSKRCSLTAFRLIEQVRDCDLFVSRNPSKICALFYSFPWIHPNHTWWTLSCPASRNTSSEAYSDDGRNRALDSGSVLARESVSGLVCQQWGTEVKLDPMTSSASLHHHLHPRAGKGRDLLQRLKLFLQISALIPSRRKDSREKAAADIQFTCSQHIIFHPHDIHRQKSLKTCVITVTDLRVCE